MPDHSTATYITVAYESLDKLCDIRPEELPSNQSEHGIPPWVAAHGGVVYRLYDFSLQWFVIGHPQPFPVL